MSTRTISIISSNGRGNGVLARAQGEARESLRSAFDPAEFKRTVALARERGLIRGGDCLGKIDKNGIEATAFGKVRSQWMDVTPDIATKWLCNNKGNRSLSEDVVHAYARDMRAGQWVATHQGVAFNDEDVLIDGQHRLEAIVLSGVTVRMMVTFGLPSKIAGREMTTMDAVDRGRPRSVADQLRIQHKMRDGAVIASVCAQLSSICAGMRTRRLSVGQTLDVFRAFEGSVCFVAKHRSKEPGLRMSGVLAGAAFAHAATATDKGNWFSSPVGQLFCNLNTGKDLGAKSAIAKLREFLLSDEAKLFTATLNRGLAELVCQAFWIELTGKPCGKLAAALDGVNYFKGLQAERVKKVAALFALPEKNKSVVSNPKA